MKFVFRGGAWDFGDSSPHARVVGIVNVTPDSFFDGGRYADPARAIDRALELVAEGADSIDVGAQSTRPGRVGGASAPTAHVGAEEEWRRLEPVLAPLAERLASRPTPIPISVDTYHASVARRALDAGASIVNDVSGLTADPDMARVAAETGAGLVIMHALGAPAGMHAPREYGDVGREVRDFLAARLAEAVAAGVEPDRIALDPGIGFSKRAEQSVEALRALPLLTGLGRPLYIGVSRKSFLGQLTGRPVEERLAAGLGATIAAVALGARIVRTHDVAATRDALLAAEAVLHPEPRAGSRSEPETSRA
ncbi:MAG TPA: dihydropteroate synthase [Candidatus Eisenbacteria bacterium]|nr:dihydropteroate synthase [Candidatus Eisenbacteria bacterium]